MELLVYFSSSDVWYWDEKTTADLRQVSWHDGLIPVQMEGGFGGIVGHPSRVTVLYSVSPSTVFPNPGPCVPRSSCIPYSTHFHCSPGQPHLIQLIEGLMISWQVEKGCLSRVTIEMCTVGGTRGPGLGNIALRISIKLLYSYSWLFCGLEMSFSEKCPAMGWDN